MPGANLDRRVTLQLATAEDREAGWADLATVWAQVDRRGRAVIFRLRWIDGISEDRHRVIFDGRVHRIRAVRETGRRAGLELETRPS